MNNHHLKAYIFFLIMSLIMVGTLVYLYTPHLTNMRSDVLVNSWEMAMIAEQVPTLSAEVSPDEISEKRIRLTGMLLHYQTLLRDLDTKTSGPSDDATRFKREQLQIRIDSLETQIKELSE